MTRTGQCMCGAVKFTGSPKDAHAACYCKMCQRWSSGMFVGIRTDNFTVTQGQEHVTVFDSSDWARRAFCNRCGSNLYYELKGQSHKSVAIGVYDDADGFAIEQVFYADRRPDSLDPAENCQMLTEAQVNEMFGSS